MPVSAHDATILISRGKGQATTSISGVVSYSLKLDYGNVYRGRDRTINLATGQITYGAEYIRKLRFEDPMGTLTLDLIEPADLSKSVVGKQDNYITISHGGTQVLKSWFGLNSSNIDAQRRDVLRQSLTLDLSWLDDLT